RRTLSGLVVLALLAATVLVTYLVYDNEREDAADADQDLARQVAVDARQEVVGVAAGLRGSAAIVESDGHVDPSRFKSFARGVVERSAFLGLSWAPRVYGKERAEFEEELGRPIGSLGADGLEPVPPDDSGSYLPIATTFPNTVARRGFLGFDTLSDAARGDVATEALEAGEPRLTRPILLAQTGETGASIYAPVSRGAGRTQSTVGVMISGVPGKAIATDLRRQLDLDTGVTITDEGKTLTGEQPPPDAVSAGVSVLGRRWEVWVEGTTSVNVVPAIAVGLSGLALSLVAAGLFAIASRRERFMSRRQRDAELQSARESLLIRITEVIEREIEVQGRLKSLARTLVPAVGDVCSVHEVTQDGTVRRAGIAALDERTEELVRALPPEPSQTSPIRAAISSREPVLYTRVAENREAKRARERGIAEAAATGDMSPADLYAADQRSNMIVPLLARGRVLGTISVSILRSTGRDPLDRDDVAFGMEVATHAAMALDNARLYEQQRDIAAILQQALLPRSLPEVAGAEVAVRHRPGRAGTEVGGDFYDLFEAGDRWFAVVGDVCGKGPEAAALTSLVRHTLRATARLGPALAVERVHEAIQASGENTYCTLCCAEIRADGDGFAARVVTAGHPEPRVVEKDGGVQRLDVTGPLVGVLDDPVFEAQEVTLHSGATFFMCSDGVPEARRNGELFGDNRLERLLSRLSPLEPAEMLHDLEEEVVDFVEGRPRDDLALFAFRVDS
ncbi:MAG TPA: SpoIIE family protein phosphatase, partial [Solirubrobacterales bacterium]|nr:SpoIIE family protein phosphatase [Solirubrobacterales bacterium]